MMKWHLFFFLLICSCESEKDLTHGEACRYLGIVNDNTLKYLNGRLIHVGRDFVAYGKYKIEGSFDEKKFVAKHRLVKSDKQDTPFFEAESSKVIWFKINKGMKRFDFFDFKNESSQIVWIDDSARLIFVENAKW